MNRNFAVLLASLLGGLVFQTPAVCAGTSPQPADTAPIPLQDFVARPEMSEMSISPGGQYLAVVIPMEDGSSILYVMDRTTLKRSATIRGSGNNVIDQFWWVNDTRLVASVAQKFGGIDRPQPTGELYAINADGSGATQLFGYRGAGTTATRVKRGGEKRYASAFVIGQIPGDDRNILVETFEWRTIGSNESSAPPSVELLDVYTGSTRTVSVGPKAESSFVADHRGQVRIAAAPDENMNLQLYVRAGNDTPWRLYNDPKTTHLRIKPLMFARDNRHLYVEISQAQKPDALYRLDLESGEKELLYSGAADPGRLLLTHDRQDAYGVVTEDGKTAFKVFDPASADARIALAVQKAFPNQVALLGSFANDGKVGLVHAYSDRNPGDFYLFDTTKMHAEYIGSVHKAIDPERMAAMQPITVKARDGVELHGYLTLPAGGSGKNLPLIVNPHGGPHGIRDEWGFNPEMQLLASRGYAVLQLNYRGSGGYGVGFLESGYRQWGLRMQDDLTDATHWAVEQGYADPKRLCIYGASYGGYAALEGVVREPDLYRCAVGYVGVYDLRLMYREGDIPHSLFGKRYLQIALGSDQDDMFKRSPVGGVDRIKAALMLVAGGRDQRVPVAHAEELKDALDKRKYPYEWLLKDGEGHGFYRTDNKLELYTKMLAFLDRNIGGGAPAH